jgi:ribose-phosphate pyrophosphokinase
MLVCSQSYPANDTVFETLLLISSLKRNGASSVSLYLPYSAYARQDKMVGPWRSLAFSDLAHFYEEAGASRVITLDIHNEAVMGCFSGKVNATNLSAVRLAAKHISREVKLHNLVVLSPDEGGVKRAKKFYEEYLAQPDDVNKDSSFAIMVKSRAKPGEVSSITVNDDFTGKACILIDDMIGSGVHFGLFREQ